MKWENAKEASVKMTCRGFRLICICSSCAHYTLKMSVSYLLCFSKNLTIIIRYLIHYLSEPYERFLSLF